MGNDMKVECKTKMIPMTYVTLDGEDFEMADLLEVLSELGSCSIRITNDTMAEVLKRLDIISHPGTRYQGATLTEKGAEKIKEIEEAIYEWMDKEDKG